MHFAGKSPRATRHLSQQHLLGHNLHLTEQQHFLGDSL